MNKSEKQRAKLIEKASVSANPICGMKIAMSIAALTAAVTCALIFFLVFKEDQEDNDLYLMILTNAYIAFAITADFYFVGAMFDYKNKIFDPLIKMTSGAYNIGTFVSALPFKASDMKLYRLERCKKQVFTMWLLTSVLIAATNIYGYDEYSGLVIGMTVLTALLLEIVFISVSLLCRSWVRGMFIITFSDIAAMILTLVSFEAFCAANTEQAAALNEKLGGASVLSVISGIIILAGLLFAVVKVAERLVSRAKNTSWKLD